MYQLRYVIIQIRDYEIINNVGFTKYKNLPEAKNKTERGTGK